jgi:hypothetical protein
MTYSNLSSFYFVNEKIWARRVLGLIREFIIVAYEISILHLGYIENEEHP